MSLRQKTLLIIGITTSCVFVALSVILSSLWLSSFTQVENQQTRQNVERVWNAITNDVTELKSTLEDWAARDDIHAFMETSAGSSEISDRFLAYERGRGRAGERVILAGYLFPPCCTSNRDYIQAKLSDSALLSITLEPFKQERLPTDWQNSNTALSNSKAIVVHPLSAVRIAGYRQLPDIYGDPDLLLRVDSPRTIYGRGQNRWHYAIASLVGVGLLLGVITLLLLEKLVLSRLARLDTGVSRLSATGDFSQRFTDNAQDELSQLTMAINRLLTNLERFQMQINQGHAELERRVEKRTQDLIEANLRLEASHREKDRLLEREQAARAEAEAANRIKDEFLAVLSHELRTPLNPILGWSKLLRTRKLDEKTTVRALETIERNAQLQTQLIEDLLDVSRILRGKLSLKISSVDLVPTIEAAIETVRLAAQAKSIEIKTMLDANVGQVSGDPNRLQQVLWNLLSNAVKFTPTGGTVEIRLSVVSGQLQQTTDDPPLPPLTKGGEQRTTNNYALLQVSDTGKGINSDFLPHVFDYFRQEDSTTTRTFGGLGLGLAIVRHLVELHGGTVYAESPGEGLGATFTAMLPLMNAVQQTPHDSKLPSDSLNLEGVKVLVVDDEIDALELIAFTLEQYGAQVKAIASPRLAIEVLAMWQPDVLLSDIGMPDIDGYKLIRQIRARPPEKGGKIPAIALTAYAGEINHQQALQAGFTAHITKPFEPDRLATAIAKLAQM